MTVGEDLKGDALKIIWRKGGCAQPHHVPDKERCVIEHVGR